MDKNVGKTWGECSNSVLVPGESAWAYHGHTRRLNNGRTVMSLYNQLFGEYPGSRALLTLLCLPVHLIPRYRDCFLNKNGDVVVYTRTGGGNRDFYDSPETNADADPDGRYKGPFNSTIRSMAGFVEDHDDPFDSTFAHFIFRPTNPAVVTTISDIMHAHGPLDPAERWQQLFRDMRTGKTTPLTERSKIVGARIINQIVNDEPDAERDGLKIIEV